MELEETDGTANEQPADDIRSALAAALAEHEPAAAETAGAKPAKAKAGEVGSETPAAESEPAQAGEANDGETAPPAEEKVSEETEAKAAETDKAAETAKAVGELTGRWTDKDKAIFAKLPPDARELLLRRHKEMEGDYSRKMNAITALKREYEPVEKLFDPWKDRMKQAGYTPSSLITAWANVEKRLMDGDGVNVVAGLIRGYKIDLGRVAQALGLRPRQAAQADQPAGERPPQPDGGQQPLALPPEITNQLRSLQDRLDAVDREKADATRRAELSALQKAEGELEAFKSAADGKGNLLHPHFDELETDMLHLAHAAIAARRPVPPLAQLYETAVWANPSTRAAHLAAEAKAQQEKAAQEARTKAAAAKKAGSSVTGAPGTSPAPTGRRQSNMSLREQLEAAAAEAEV